MQGFSSPIADSAAGSELLAGNAEALSHRALALSPDLTFPYDSRPANVAVKRALDFTLSLLMLCSLCPLMAAAAIAIRLGGSGPVFYLSERVGRSGRIFLCYKFRTMVVDAELLQNELRVRNERDEILFKVTEDPRVTRVGRFLRKYSVDELPQLLNVLRGEMSLVGPRPCTPDQVRFYGAAFYDYCIVRPGITGLWQVSGRNRLSYAERVRLDAEYIRTWSLQLDIRIFCRTVAVVCSGQ